MNKKKFKLLDFEKLNGLLPVIIQDQSTSKVLMLGFMNEKALELTLERGHVVFFSRTRQSLWEKGKNSGNYLIPREILVDCDSDTLLVKVDFKGTICHTGAKSCFDVLR